MICHSGIHQLRTMPNHAIRPIKYPPYPRFCPKTGGWKTCFLFSVVPPRQAQRAPSVEIMTKTNPLPPLLGAQIPIPEYKISCHQHPYFCHKGRRRVQTSSAPAVVPLHLSQLAGGALRRRDQLRRSSSWRELVDEGGDWLRLLSGKMGGEGAIQAVSKAWFWLELI